MLATTVHQYSLVASVTNLCYTGLPSVQLRIFEAKHVDMLVGDRTHDVGFGYEDAIVRTEDHNVGQR